MSLGPQCKVCQRDDLQAINRRLLKGESPRQVAEWLTEHGLKITRQAVSNHVRKHLAVLETAKEVLVKKAVSKAVDKVVADVELLDELAGVGIRIVRNLSELADQEGGVLALEMPQIVLLGTAMREVRAAVEAKNDILHGKKVTLDGQFTGVAALMAFAFSADAGPGTGPAAKVVGPGGVLRGGPGAPALESPEGHSEGGRLSLEGGGEERPQGQQVDVGRGAGTLVDSDDAPGQDGDDQLQRRAGGDDPVA